jgi:hypothetical protein
MGHPEGSSLRLSQTRTFAFQRRLTTARTEAGNDEEGVSTVRLHQRH